MGRTEQLPEREELVSRRIEEAAVKRIRAEFAILGVFVAVLGILGILGLSKYLENSISTSVSANVMK